MESTRTAALCCYMVAPHALQRRHAATTMYASVSAHELAVAAAVQQMPPPYA
jgi:hypothetical protein